MSFPGRYPHHHYLGSPEEEYTLRDIETVYKHLGLFIQHSNQQINMNENKEFYMNYAEGGGAPTVTFSDFATAATEAKRLAITTKRRIFTLKAIAVSTIPQPEVNTTLIGAPSKRRKKKGR